MSIFNKKLFFYLILLIITPNLQCYLSTLGNQIVNSKGQEIRIKGVSWFGFETPIFVADGLWARNYQSMIQQIKNLGFNTIRLPYCNQMFDSGSIPQDIDYSLNPDLKNLSSLEIMDKIIKYATDLGLFIILDHHRSNAGAGPNENGLWYTNAFPNERFINDWKMLANRYLNNINVIGVDLHNEPHGPATWGSGNLNTDWRAAAIQTGNAILSINPNLLIIVEGIEIFNNKRYWWGGNLMGVRDFPIQLNINNRLVYSPHDYPNSVSSEPWFRSPNFPNNLPVKFRRMWGFIFEQNIAPIILGEFGSRFKDPKDIQWFQQIRKFLNCRFANANCNVGISWIWWSWNPNSSDTGGILRNNWETPIRFKLKKLAPLLR